MTIVTGVPTLTVPSVAVISEPEMVKKPWLISTDLRVTPAGSLSIATLPGAGDGRCW